jgi:hypothetical protein
VRRTRFLPVARAKARRQTSVVCLAATVTPGKAEELSNAVLARLAGSGPDAGTVVLALDGDIDSGCLQTVCTLHEGLQERGIRFRVVIGAQEAAQELRASAVSATVTALEVHPCLRSAVLAACAALPGPGLVNAQVRAALSTPVEHLHLARDEWDSASEVA